jgi:hypothetical protein
MCQGSSNAPACTGNKNIHGTLFISKNILFCHHSATKSVILRFGEITLDEKTVVLGPDDIGLCDPGIASGNARPER